MYQSGEKAAARTGYSYGYGDNRYCSLDTHCFLHEMGHMFGLNDYYDYSGQYQPAGGLSMQDLNVGGHDPYSGLLLGWASAYIPTSGCSIELKPYQDSREVVLLTPQWNEANSPYDEYILIEYYTPTGLNQFDAEHAYSGREQLPTESGIRIWHVDARLTYGTTFRKPRFVKDPLARSSDIMYAFTNSYEGSGRVSPFGNDYQWFNELQYIQKSNVADYAPSGYITNNNIFQ